MDGKRALEDGKLVLFKRAGIWQARIAVTDRRYIYRSLKTSDEAKAVTAGRRLFYRTEIKVEQGLPVDLREITSRQPKSWHVDRADFRDHPDHAQGRPASADVPRTPALRPATTAARPLPRKCSSAQVYSAARALAAASCGYSAASASKRTCSCAGSPRRFSGGSASTAAKSFCFTK